MFFHANVDYANVVAVDRVGKYKSFTINLNGWSGGWWRRELGNSLMKRNLM